MIHDHDDLELPAAEGKALARRLPSAETFLTEGLGHRRILRDRGVVAAAMDFIVHRDAMTGADPVSLNKAASAA